MYSQKMSVMSDQHDQAVNKMQRDFIKELVDNSKEMITEMASSLLNVDESQKQIWNEMFDQATKEVGNQKQTGQQNVMVQMNEVYSVLYKILYP